ncbi:MAG: hypothetical protein P8K78_04965 [Pirellulales bacterium]|nr:hypothetical protein [Pirellulales bacterium]
MKCRCIALALGLLLGFSQNIVFAEDESVEDRIELLEEHLFAIDAQLGKLEMISRSLNQLREEDLRRLRQLMWPGNKKLNKKPEAGKAESQQKADKNLPLPVLDDDASPEERISALEKMTARIARKYELIDSIAEQLHLLRNEDLAGISRDMRGLTETSKKVGPGGKSIVVPPSRHTPRGELIFNNTTGMRYRVSVNGRERRIPPGKTVIRLPIGPVETQLLDFEGPRTWPESQWKQIDGKYTFQLDLKN